VIQASRVRQPSDLARPVKIPGKIALVSVSGIGYDRIEEAAKAVDQEKANIVVFPELGFLPFEDDITASTMSNWKAFASQKNVVVAIGVRHQQRNTLMVFTPDGAVHTACRRDGHNTPLPMTPEDKKPLVLDTDFGRIGFLICDESRTKHYLDELRSYKVDLIVSPNKVGSFTEQVLLQDRDKSLYWCDTFHADVLGSTGRGWTHAYAAATQQVALNAFGQPLHDGSASAGTATTVAGLRYSISTHSVGST
jgi:Carbon-nitrogen hydrolase